MMSRFSNISILVTLLLGLGVAKAESYDYATVVNRNLWSEGRNVTGIMKDSISVSNVELRYGAEQGEFRNFSDAKSEWSAKADAKTLMHYDRVSMVGSFSYEHWEGKEMCGSMFIAPNSYPFDVLEFTPGDKRLQSYDLMGGITSQLRSRWAIGVKGEFSAQNYAKFKDLRHSNYRMELALMPSISYSFSDNVIGLTYIYSRNAETIRAQEVGSSVAAYYAFLDKGLMSGAYETWGGTGIHLNESGIDGFPVRENFNGAALQIQSGRMFAELEYLHGRGSVGEKLTYWFDFPSNEFSARIGSSRVRNEGVHQLQIAARYFMLRNNENVVGSETNNGVSTTVIYGSNQILSTTQLALMPRYRFFGLRSGVDAEVGANYVRDFSRATQMYPYVSELKSNVFQLYGGGMVPLGRSRSLELRGRALFSTGSINDYGYMVSDSLEAADEPVHLEEYYNVDNEFLTATYLSGSLSLRYVHKSSAYLQVAALYTHAFDVEYVLGNSRISYSATVGYKF